MARLIKFSILLVLVLLVAGEVLGHRKSHSKVPKKIKGHSHVPKSQHHHKPTPVAQPAVQGIPQPTSASSVASPTPATAANGKNICRSYTDTFSNTRIVEAQDYNNDPKTAEWINLSGTTSTYSLDGGQLNMILNPPSSYETITTSYHPYNSQLGYGLTLNSTYLMHYGTVSAKIKASPIGGVVTAYITMSPEGDEIDWELVGNDTLHAQSNWYWNGVILWGVHGGNHTVPPPGISETFNTYTLNWTPDAITWLINGNPVRTLNKADTVVNGTAEFPNRPSHIQLGIWDGSGAPGTADWANGPIDWKSQKSNPRTYVSEVKIECDPTWNQVIN
ncbi:1715_t:CDS:2 [Ambispora leptoticha]|uniref:1715_t:CDS:1 n=1 Tax=Ambispora leptoticha TaxID=144679 RepID=A0A9N9BFA2_9GLOM|nr:1715_t:CDS:2 [Ambispora leptoticha]